MSLVKVLSSVMVYEVRSVRDDVCRRLELS